MREIVSVAIAILVLAGISVAIINGGNTSLVIGSMTNGFSDMVKSATLQK